MFIFFLFPGQRIKDLVPVKTVNILCNAILVISDTIFITLLVISSLRRCGYDGWLTVESFGRALPELAGATRVWRDLFDDLDSLFAESVAFIRREWAAAGERLA